jgi:hypothetical protein
MKPTPACLSPVAVLGALPPSEKRPISLSGTDESGSSFEALLRAVPGSRRTAVASNAHAADKTQLASTESAGALDLLDKDSQRSVSSRSRLGENIDDESGRGLVLSEPVASPTLPFWPAHLAAAWVGPLPPIASGAGTSDGLVQTGLVQAEPARIGLDQASLAVTALGADDSLPGQPKGAGSQVASSAAGQTEIPAGLVMMDPGRETFPVLPALPGSPLALTAADQASGRRSAEVLAKAFSVETATMPRANSAAPGAPIMKAATSSFDLIEPRALATPFAVAMSSAAAPKPGLRALSGLSDASGLRLSAEPRPLDSAAVVLAQCGAVSVYAKANELEQNRAPSALAEVQQMADARGAWVPELGGIVCPVDKSTGHIDFSQHLAEQVDAWVSQSLQVAELRLNDLGSNPVLVRIEMNGQQASVMFRTDVLACREAIATQLDQLCDLLSAQGLHLADASVAGSGADSQPGREARPSQVWGEPAARRSAPETAAVTQSLPRRLPASAGRSLDVFV